MATLWVNGEIGPLLRDWLQGDWAILFSHPLDFQYQGLETDRWLSILREEFCAREVRPLACRRTLSELDAGWASELVADRSLLRLDTDAAARNLRADLTSLPPRFVVILDQTLQRRGVLKYSAGRNSISPLDLLASIDMLRRRSPARIAA